MYDYFIRSYECTEDGAISVPHLLNFLQETASLHAGERGFDFPVIHPETGGVGAWVVAQMRVHIDHYPLWRDTLRFDTFPYGVRGLFAHRDFIFTLTDGTPCGIGTTRWMLIDPETRRAVRVPETVKAFDEPRAPVFGAGDAFMRLRYPDAPETEYANEYRVMRAHIDLNRHVNNVHYVTWMLESVPETYARSHRLTDLEITFRSETLYGETVRSLCTPVDENRFYHRVCSPAGADHIVAATTWVPAAEAARGEG